MLAVWQRQILPKTAQALARHSPTKQQAGLWRYFCQSLDSTRRFTRRLRSFQPEAQAYSHCLLAAGCLPIATASSLHHRHISRPSAAAAASVVGAASPATTCLFTLGTLYCVPFFALMLLAPRWRATRQLMEADGVFIPLALVYAALLVLSWEPDTLTLMMPGSLEEGLQGGFRPQFFPKLEGIMRLFSRVTTAASLWVHLLAINLYAAKVAFLEGVEMHIPTFHSILLTMVFGPLGLLSHLLTKGLLLSFRRPVTQKHGETTGHVDL